MNGYLREISGHINGFLRREPISFQLLHNMRVDNRSETSMHFVVQRQLTDVPVCKKNNLQQLLTSIHKSHFIHGVSLRDFVTFLLTCTAIYKVEPNAMENILCQVKALLPEDKWPNGLSFTCCKI